MPPSQASRSRKSRSCSSPSSTSACFRAACCSRVNRSAVARDDRRLLARLLLADAHGSSLLGALVEVTREPRLELVGRERHGSQPRRPPGASLHPAAVRARPRSRRQRSFTFTRRSRKTGRPSSNSISGRARVADLPDHAAALADEDPLLRAVSTSTEADTRPPVDLLDLHRDRVRHLLARELERLLPHELGDAALERLVGQSRRPGSRAGPRAAASTSSSRSAATPSPVRALTGCSAWKSPSAAAGAICVGDLGRA